MTKLLIEWNPKRKTPERQTRDIILIKDKLLKLIQTSERQTRDIILLKDKHFIKDKALKKLPKDKHKLVKDKHVNWYFKRQTSKRPILERQPRERYFKRTNYWETNS